MGGGFSAPTSCAQNAQKWPDENTSKIIEEQKDNTGLGDAELAVNLAGVLSSFFQAKPLEPLSPIVAKRIINRRSAMYGAPEIEGVPKEKAYRMSENKLEKTPALGPVFSAHATPQVIAERLRAAREAKGWTQQDLANAMGLKSRRTVQNLEGAREGVTVTAVRSAMEALEI